MISLVVPIYGESDLIGRLHAEVRQAMSRLGDAWEVVYVNDGSRDDSLGRLLAIQRLEPNVVVVDLSRNWGHQPALTAGLGVAKGDAVVLMDGDLQDPPSVIVEMVALWRAGAQVVVAQRRSRAESWPRRWLYALFYRCLGMLSDFPIPLNAGIFGLLDRRAADAIVGLGESNRYLPGLRAWVGYDTQVVYYERQDRAAGDSKQSLWRLLRYGLDAIFSFSYKPLRLSLALGCSMAVLAFLYGSVLFIFGFLGLGMFGRPVVAGYTTTILSILFLGAIQLISLGILGEYIGRIYDEVKRRPLYLVKAVHGRKEHDGSE
jgi:dolichol-phosphate mannosyltransferase